MRFRNLNTRSDIRYARNAFVALIGHDDYYRALVKRSETLTRSIVAGMAEERFPIEFSLFEMEERRGAAGHTSRSFSYKSSNPGIDLILSIAQVIPHLSEQAKRRLRGQIIDGILSAGLQNLQHELLVAKNLSDAGCDIQLHDLETGGGYDFLATKDGYEYEVEAKCFTIDTGNPIHESEIIRLYNLIHEASLAAPIKNNVPVITIQLHDRLPGAEQDLAEIVKACRDVIVTDRKIELGTCDVTKIELPDISREALRAFVAQDTSQRNVRVLISHRPPSFVVRILSRRPLNAARYIGRSLAQSALNQFSGKRPGFLWMHMHALPDKFTFGLLSQIRKGKPGFFQQIAKRVCEDERRQHVLQIRFSADAGVERHGPIAQATMQSVGYTSPHCRFKVPPIEPGVSRDKRARQVDRLKRRHRHVP